MNRIRGCGWMDADVINVRWPVAGGWVCGWRGVMLPWLVLVFSALAGFAMHPSCDLENCKASISQYHLYSTQHDPLKN